MLRLKLTTRSSPHLILILVEQRLTMAGVRLAALLNAVFDETHEPTFDRASVP